MRSQPSIKQSIRSRSFSPRSKTLRFGRDRSIQHVCHARQRFRTSRTQLRVVDADLRGHAPPGVLRTTPRSTAASIMAAFHGPPGSSRYDPLPYLDISYGTGTTTTGIRQPESNWSLMKNGTTVSGYGHVQILNIIRQKGRLAANKLHAVAHAALE